MSSESHQPPAWRSLHDFETYAYCANLNSQYACFFLRRSAAQVNAPAPTQGWVYLDVRFDRVMGVHCDAPSFGTLNVLTEMIEMSLAEARDSTIPGVPEFVHSLWLARSEEPEPELRIWVLVAITGLSAIVAACSVSFAERSTAWQSPGDAP